MIEKILKDIKKERKNQDEAWGIQNHSPEMWITILTEEVGEAAAEALELLWTTKRKHTREDMEKIVGKFREELVQCAAVAVAAIENVDRIWPT